MTDDPDLVAHLRRLEAELVSFDVWQSRAGLEARMSPDFIEIGSGGILTRAGLISIILGTDPGVWHAEDFAVRELAPTVALVTYRSLIDRGDGGPSLIALRSSIWRREDDRWRIEFHQITRLSSPSA
jgi:glyoxylase I family protein